MHQSFRTHAWVRAKWSHQRLKSISSRESDEDFERRLSIHWSNVDAFMTSATKLVDCLEHTSAYDGGGLDKIV